MVGEAEAFVGVEGFVDFVELLLWLIGGGFLDDAFAHEDGVGVGGVLEGDFTIFDPSDVLGFVPVEGFDVGAGDAGAEDGEVALWYLGEEGEDALSVFLFGGGGATAHVGAVDAAVEVVVDVEDGGESEDCFVEAGDAFFAHADVDGGEGVTVVAEVGDCPDFAAVLALLEEEAGGGCLVGGADAELVTCADDFAGLGVVMEDYVEALAGGGVDGCEFDHVVL